MISFKHIVITRFNLPKRWDTDKQGNVILDSKWLKERFELFENFCLPSMVGQTCKNFEWWVYYDEKTESVYKKKIESIEREFPFFKPKYERSYEAFEKNMPVKIYEYLKNESVKWLITTRLDNDDMLAKDTIGILQNNLKERRDYLLEIPCGYTLEINSKPKPKLRKLKLELNPFISYIEQVKSETPIKSVYYYQHTEWRGVKIISVSNRPQWVQIIHEKNLFNRINGELVFPVYFYSRFIFNSEALQIETDYKLLIIQLIKWLKMTTLIERIIKIKSFFK